MKLMMGDQTAGVGGHITWDSQTEGKGKQTISKLDQDQFIEVQLEFYEPWTGTASADFQFEKVSPNSTKVTWGMNGKNSSMTEKFFYMLMDFEAMIGKDYETGLTAMKAAVEKAG